MPTAAAHRGPSRLRRAGAGPALVLAGLAALLTLPPAGTPAAAAPVTPARAATGACQTVGGAPASGAGPQRATVVVDTGSGPVWSACISFSGTITGAAALEKARATITDLDPVYEIYGGEGAAICKLRGVGNDPPDCLGKSASYWVYRRNGTYASGGAGRSKVGDGDVEAWRWGNAGTPVRPATAGTRAVAAPPATTTTTRPSGGGGTPGTTAPHGVTGSAGGTTVPGGLPGATTAPGGPTTTAAPGATTVPGATTSTSAAAGSSTTDAAGESLGVPGAGHKQGGASPAAAPSSGTGSGPASADRSSGSSGAASAAAFGAAVVALVGGGLLLRRRRAATTAAQPSLPTT